MAARVGLKQINDSGLVSSRTRACQCLSLARKSACGLTSQVNQTRFTLKGNVFVHVRVRVKENRSGAETMVSQGQNLLAERVCSTAICCKDIEMSSGYQTLLCPLISRISMHVICHAGEFNPQTV